MHFTEEEEEPPHFLAGNWSMLMLGANQVAPSWNKSGDRPWPTAQTLTARCCFINSLCWDPEWHDTHILTSVSDLENCRQAAFFLPVCGYGCRTTALWRRWAVRESLKGKVGQRSSFLVSAFPLDFLEPMKKSNLFENLLKHYLKCFPPICTQVWIWIEAQNVYMETRWINLMWSTRLLCCFHHQCGIQQQSRSLPAKLQE